MIKPGKIFLLLFLLLPPPVLAGDGGFRAPERTGLGLTFGHSYDPGPTFGFLQVTGVLQYDYDQIWPHRAPEPLYFKVETSLGLADYRGEMRLMTSVNMLAQYYLDSGGSERLHPYLEAGIGLIYTDFTVAGQGLRLNFNPQAGIGCDLQTQEGGSYFASLRLHHLSNSGLDHDNRGVNSVLVQFGRWF